VTWARDVDDKQLPDFALENFPKRSIKFVVSHDETS
jgi:hypothetical protein